MRDALFNSLKQQFSLLRMSALVAFLGIGAFGLAFVHPAGDVRNARSDLPLMSTARVESPVLDILQRSCQNCHSERTTWPWYSRMAPMSWLVERDVQGGRSHWNMSQWEHYSLDERGQMLSQIGPMVRNRKMPLPQYLLLHPEAKLTDGDADVLYQWARNERKRLESEPNE